MSLYLKLKDRIDSTFEIVFSDKVKRRFEFITIGLGILGFIIHLLLIALNQSGWVEVGEVKGGLLEGPLHAIYTPFSFILVYEVFLLVYYLPRSFSISIAKQYEIISLIVIRRMFKDIEHLDLSYNSLISNDNLVFLVDMLGFIVLFALIFLFYRLVKFRPRTQNTKNIDRFVRIKKLLTLILVPILVCLSLYSFFSWIVELNQFSLGKLTTLSDINKIFYNEFFTTLILFDVLVLMISFRYTEQYAQLIRNSGFIISTVLIRLSFSVEGWLNMALILTGVVFGVLIQAIYNRLAPLFPDGRQSEQKSM